VRMFWTPVGLETLRQYPRLFNRGALEAKLAEYETAAEQSSDSEFAVTEQVAPPPVIDAPERTERGAVEGGPAIGGAG